MLMRVTRQQMERMIRYEDSDVVVVHKPPFLAVETRDSRQQDLVSMLINRRVLKGEAAYIGVINRLDQPVEGLLVLAKTRDAAAGLSAGLCAGDFIKEYLAVVRGIVQESGALVHTLKKDGRTNTSVVVPAGTAGGKEARLTFERLALKGGNSLLCIRLDTGRHHQIRVQFAAIGHPLRGDVKYGAQMDTDCRTGTHCGADQEQVDRGLQMRRQRAQPLALCSRRLVFAHPRTKELMEFCAEPVGTGFDEFRGAFG